MIVIIYVSFSVCRAVCCFEALCTADVFLVYPSALRRMTLAMRLLVQFQMLGSSGFMKYATYEKGTSHFDPYFAPPQLEPNCDTFDFEGGTFQDGRGSIIYRLVLKGLGEYAQKRTISYLCEIEYNLI